MGNKFTKTVKCEADPTILPPPPPMTSIDNKGQILPNSGPGGDAGTLIPPDSQFTENPGTMDDFHKKCKEILPMTIEGAKIIINKSLSQQFQVSHNLTMSSIQPSGYRFGSTFVGNMISPTEPSSLLMGDIDPSGNLNAQGFYHLTNALKFKYATQIMNSKFQGIQTSLEFKGRSYTASGTVINPSISSESVIGVVQYLQSVTPRVCVGGEVMYQKSPAIPQGSMTAVTASARYSDELNSISGFFGHAGGALYLYRRVNEDLQFGLEIERIQQQFSASIAYQYDIPKANFTMKAMIDNNWTVTGLLEKRLLPMPCSFSLCGSINHIKNQFRLGCGLNIEL